MKIFVEDVEIGAEYENIIYDFWVNALLEGGQQIKIFDSVPFDLRKNIGTTVEAIVLAGFLKNICTGDISTKTEFVGKFLGEYTIPDYSIRARDDTYHKVWFGFKTMDGIFLLDSRELEKTDLRVGDCLAFDVGRFDLILVKFN